ncbi:glycosyl hydrolase family 38 protein [Ancylostoma duodenale]|uniref:mannosyl-oligosaccharide 1,3-1,6-alpha-mannosidase n=1 Tax=Ancylostoma duodenale TaxID=51022 RepID=A0A0C2CS89_9BILA|nr:glycosyl hydrolase family 38 protein [Ancylostoma duodenale]
MKIDVFSKVIVVGDTEQALCEPPPGTRAFGIDTRSVPSESLHREKSIANMKMNIDHLQNVLKNNRDEISELKKQVADVERRRNQDWAKQVEKENEVYDEKAEAEKALEKKVEQIAGDANHKAVEEEEKAVVPEPNRGNKVAVVHEFLKKTTLKSSPPVCEMRKEYTNVHTDVQMLDVYNLLTFDNPDGGVWKQGWDVVYDKEKVAQEKKLEVIVIPHSHCDPGWIKTFEEYYQSQTRNILDLMVKNLNDNQREMRFIYAEISFFELWWKDQTDDVRAKVKQLLASGQLEIVTGGWVMTDEANAHYFSIITELLEGHEWIKNHLGGFRPTSHWSIDPFGLSPSIPYLLTAANITNAAIQRIHYSVKKYLSKNKQLEFMWRQLWGSHGRPEMRTHVFPFYSYDAPHSCGPDPKICCQFDFRRLPSLGIGCPWGIPPERITENNAKERYDTDSEWTEQYQNYMRLFEEMNKNKEWNIHARFGTLSDYFTELDRSLRTEQQSLPVFSGDFFTYADRDDHYWSGYFTSRPFYKQMDRVLQHQLRAAEIAFSLKAMKGESPTDEVFAKLVLARRALSLFQHHDGITGTAKDHVVVDYGNKMLAALEATEKVLSETLSDLISAEVGSTNNMVLDEYRKEQDTMPLRRPYAIGDFVVLFNTLSRSRVEPTCIYVTSVHATLKVDSDREIKQQISPVFVYSDGSLIQSNVFELCFVDESGPFGVSVYEVVESSTNEQISMPTITAKAGVKISEFKFNIVSGSSFSLENSLFSAHFDATTGFLKSVTPKDHKEILVDLHYVHYGARGYKQHT